MAGFFDILSTQSSSVLNSTYIDDKRVIIPTTIDKEILYNKCKTEINSPELGPEKAVYIMLESAAIQPQLQRR